MRARKAKLRQPPQSGKPGLSILATGGYNPEEELFYAHNNEELMMKNLLIKTALVGGIFLSGGCSSVMSHTGGKEGTYPGTRASAEMLSDGDNGWATKSLVALDMPFTAVMDTVLLPWDFFRKDSSVRSRVEKSEQETLATNSVIPPAPMPAQ